MILPIDNVLNSDFQNTDEISMKSTLSIINGCRRTKSSNTNKYSVQWKYHTSLPIDEHSRFELNI